MAIAERFRRGLCVALSIGAIAVLAIDPDPRGPFAIAADLWLAGHDAKAETFFARGAAELRDSGVDPTPLTLSVDPKVGVRADPAERERVFAWLDRLARDDRSKAIYRALWFARTGDRASARAALGPALEGRAPPRIVELAAALAD